MIRRVRRLPSKAPADGGLGHALEPQQQGLALLRRQGRASRAGVGEHRLGLGPGDVRPVACRGDYRLDQVVAALVLGDVRIGAGLEHGQDDAGINVGGEHHDPASAGHEGGNPLGDHLPAQFEVEHDHVRLRAEIGQVGRHLDNADPPGRVTVHPGRDALDDDRVILDDSDGYLTFHLASTHSTSSSR